MGDDFIWNPDGESSAEALFRRAAIARRVGDFWGEIPREQVEKYGVFSVEDGKVDGSGRETISKRGTVKSDQCEQVYYVAGITEGNCQLC